MKENLNFEKKATNGLGLLEVLFLIFLVLKLTHLVEFSWWFVFSPLIIELVIIAVFIIVFFIIHGREDDGLY